MHDYKGSGRAFYNYYYKIKSLLNEHAQYKKGLGCPQNGTHKTFQYQKNGSCVSFSVYIIICTSSSCCNSCLINIMCMFSADIPFFGYVMGNSFLVKIGPRTKSFCLIWTYTAKFVPIDRSTFGCKIWSQVHFWQQNSILYIGPILFDYNKI